MRNVDNRAKLPRENSMALLINVDELTEDSSEKARELKRRVPIYGSLKTELRIQHRHIPHGDLDKFVDGWVSGKRQEGFGHSRYHRMQPSNTDWQYGYRAATEGNVYFTQALHSWIIWSLGEHGEITGPLGG